MRFDEARDVATALDDSHGWTDFGLIGRSWVCRCAGAKPLGMTHKSLLSPFSSPPLFFYLPSLAVMELGAQSMLEMGGKVMLEMGGDGWCSVGIWWCRFCSHTDSNKKRAFRIQPGPTHTATAPAVLSPTATAPMEPLLQRRLQQQNNDNRISNQPSDRTRCSSSRSNSADSINTDSAPLKPILRPTSHPFIVRSRIDIVVTSGSTGHAQNFSVIHDFTTITARNTTCKPSCTRSDGVVRSAVV